MRWFFRWLVKKCNDAQYLDCTSIGSVPSVSLRNHDDGMNFQIYLANGGYVLEYSKYDHKTDRSNRALHLITNDQDLGTSIAHAITIEMLRK